MRRGGLTSRWKALFGRLVARSAREADLIVAGAFTRYRHESPAFGSGSMTKGLILQTQIATLMAQ